MTLCLLTEKDVSQMVLIEESVQLAPWTEEAFNRCIIAKYEMWGFKIDEKLIGFVIYSNQVGECHILNLCVHPQHQRQGCGKQLLLNALKQAKQKSAEIAFLEVRRSNKAALSLYHSAGFTEIGERKGYYSTVEGREDAILLAKDLSVA